MPDGLRRHLARGGWTLIFSAAALVGLALWSPDPVVRTPPSRPQPPPAPPWKAPTDPQLLARLEDPAERMMAIYDVDLGKPGEIEVTRTIPLPPRNGKPRSIEITRRGLGFTTWIWIIRENGVVTESGEWSFGP